MRYSWLSGQGTACPDAFWREDDLALGVQRSGEPSGWVSEQGGTAIFAEESAAGGGETIGRALVKPRPSRYNQKREAGTMAAPMASEPTAPTVGGAAELGK